MGFLSPQTFKHIENHTAKTQFSRLLQILKALRFEHHHHHSHHIIKHTPDDMEIFSITVMDSRERSEVDCSMLHSFFFLGLLQPIHKGLQCLDESLPVAFKNQHRNHKFCSQFKHLRKLKSQAWYQSSGLTGGLGSPGYLSNWDYSPFWRIYLCL